MMLILEIIRVAIGVGILGALFIGSMLMVVFNLAKAIEIKLDQKEEGK